MVNLLPGRTTGPEPLLLHRRRVFFQRRSLQLSMASQKLGSITGLVEAQLLLACPRMLQLRLQHLPKFLSPILNPLRLPMQIQVRPPGYQTRAIPAN